MAVVEVGSGGGNTMTKRTSKSLTAKLANAQWVTDSMVPHYDLAIPNTIVMICGSGRLS